MPADGAARVAAADARAPEPTGIAEYCVSEEAMDHRSWVIAGSTFDLRQFATLWQKPVLSVTFPAIRAGLERPIRSPRFARIFSKV